MGKIRYTSLSLLLFIGLVSSAQTQPGGFPGPNGSDDRATEEAFMKTKEEALVEKLRANIKKQCKLERELQFDDSPDALDSLKDALIAYEVSKVLPKMDPKNCRTLETACVFKGVESDVIDFFNDKKYIKYMRGKISEADAVALKRFYFRRVTTKKKK